MDKKVKQIIMVILGLSESEILPKVDFEEYAQFDSLKHIKLVAALEDEFNITLSDDEISSLTNYENIIGVIKGKNLF